MLLSHARRRAMRCFCGIYKIQIVQSFMVSVTVNLYAIIIILSKYRIKSRVSCEPLRRPAHNRVFLHEKDAQQCLMDRLKNFKKYINSLN